MWNWLARLLGHEPDLAMTPNPLDVNASPNGRAVRNQQRMDRIKQAIASGDKRPELKAELKRREKGGR